jgi:hypothetical protein
MKGVVSLLISGFIVYILSPSMSLLITSLPFTATPKGLVVKVGAVLVLWLVIYGLLKAMIGRRTKH